MMTNFYNSIPGFLSGHASSDPEKKEKKNVTLVLNGNEILSLKDLREHFQAEEIMRYFLEGTLTQWLEQNYYEVQADAIKRIDSKHPGCMKKLCLALGVDYLESDHLSEEDRNKLEERRKLVSEYTSDPKILSEIWLVATNQSELAELIDRGEKNIYLCKNSFSIPISVPDMNYIVLEPASIENPYTAKQYERAGIHVSGICLPENENPETVMIAHEAAIHHGYDDFHEYHSPLASVFHKKLKSSERYPFFDVPYNSSLGGKFFSSKSECTSVRDRCVRKAYDYAQSVLSVGTSNSISKEPATFYSEHIQSVFSDMRQDLEKLSKLNGTETACQNLFQKVDNSYRSLLESFDQELKDNSDYYKMYDFNYFIEKADIETHDHRISEEFFWRAMETIFSDSIEYSINDLYSVISEIEHDLKDYANTFYGTAFSIYKNYVSEIEQLLDTIGNHLPEMEPEESLEDYLIRCCAKKAM